MYFTCMSAMFRFMYQFVVRSSASRNCGLEHPASVVDISLSLFIGGGSRCEIFQKRPGNTKQPPRVPIGLLRLLDQNWITFLVNSLRRRGYNAGGGRGSRGKGEGKGMKRAGRKERHGQSRRNESGLLLRRVSKFPTRAAAATARLGGGDGRGASGGAGMKLA